MVSDGYGKIMMSGRSAPISAYRDFFMVAFLASISLSLIGSTSRATSPNQLVNVNHGPMVEAPAAPHVALSLPLESAKQTADLATVIANALIESAEPPRARTIARTTAALRNTPTP